MDATDIRILRTMGIQPFGPQPQHRDALKSTHIAEQLGLTPETVRERVQRMEAAGFIAGYEVYPNLRHFGLDSTTLLFQVHDEQRRARLPQDLRPVDGLLSAHYFFGPDVCIDLAYESAGEFERRRQLLANICGDPNPSRFFSWHLPPVRRPLTRLDWRIIHALRGKAKRPLPELAEQLNIGYRTLKRHYDRLVDEGSIYSIPHIAPSESYGIIPFWLLFHLRRDAPHDTPQRIAQAYEDHQVYADVPASPEFGNFGLILFAHSPAQVEELRRKATSIQGVERARALIAYDQTPFGDWIDERIQAELRRLPPVTA